MPIYEFICKACGLKFETLVRASEEVRCPKCDHQDLKKLMSTFAFSSRDQSGNVTASSSGCSGCTSSNCSTCSR